MPEHQAQIHRAHEFHLAWKCANLATGHDTGKKTCDNAYWIEAHTDRTVIHASNVGDHHVGRYVRVTIPTTQPGTPTGWKRIVLDPPGKRPAAKVVDVCKAAGNPAQATLDELGEEAHIRLLADRVQLAALIPGGSPDGGTTTTTTTLEFVDVEWPYQIIRLYDDHETDPTASLFINESVGYLAAVRRFVGCDFDTRVNGSTGIAAFGPIRLPSFPDVTVEGCAHTKST